MFIAKILLANVLVPTAVSAVSALAARYSLPYVGGQEKSDPQADSTKHESLLHVGLGAAAAFVAIGLAIGLRNGFSLFPEDAWLRIPAATLVVAICGLFSAPAPMVLRWTVRLCSLAMAGWLVFPTGEAWEFLLPNRNYWMAAITISALLGWWGIETRTPFHSAALALSWIPCFIASAYLTSQSFLKVTEPLMAISSVIGCLGIAVLFLKRTALLRGATGPCLMASSSATAHAQFNSFLGLPDSLTLLAMFSPAMVAVCSIPFVFPRSNRQVKKLPGLAVMIIASLAISLAIVVWTQICGGGGEEDW